MPERSDELQRDIAIVLKHIRFIMVMVVAALLVAVGSAFAASSTFRADTEAEIRIEGIARELEGSSAIPKLDTFVLLAQSEEVAEEAARRLGKDRSQSAELIDKVQVSGLSADSSDRLSIRAKGDSRDEAVALANAWMEAFVDKAQGVTVDEEILSALRVRADDVLLRLEQFSPIVLSERDQAAADLGIRQTTLARLKTDATRIEEALEFVRENAPSASPGELRIALGAFLSIEEAAFLPDSIDEIMRGLELREQALNQSIDRLTADTTKLGDEVRSLGVAAAEFDAARSLHEARLGRLAEAELAAQRTEVDIQVIRMATDASGGVNWLARLGAAAAFGLVVGVVGAFGLELAGTWLRSSRRENAP